MQKFKTYQLALELAKDSRSLTLKAPYRDQFNHAVLSISLNLAEGSAKNSKADRRRFYEIALGSLREVQALIDILELQQLAPKADCLGAHLYKLCTKI